MPRTGHEGAEYGVVVHVCELLNGHIGDEAVQGCRDLARRAVYCQD